VRYLKKIVIVKGMSGDRGARGAATTADEAAEPAVGCLVHFDVVIHNKTLCTRVSSEAQSRRRSNCAWMVSS
jgi:hypothetical protein